MPISRKRLRKLKDGTVEPHSKQEWAVLQKHVRRVNADALRILHRNAAIRKGSISAGKIVVVPPKESL